MGSEPNKSTAEVLMPPAQQPPDTEFLDVGLHLRQQVLAPREADLANTLGLKTVEIEAEQKAFTDTIRQSGLEANDLRKRIYDGFVDARIAQLRGGEDEDELLTRIQRDNEETRQTLAATYGRGESEQLLARAQKWVKTQPKLHALLGTNGMGSRPDIVIPIVEHLRRTGWKG